MLLGNGNAAMRPLPESTIVADGDWRDILDYTRNAGSLRPSVITFELRRSEQFRNRPRFGKRVYAVLQRVLRSQLVAVLAGPRLRADDEQPRSNVARSSR